jgi:hypothetical protein
MAEKASRQEEIEIHPGAHLKVFSFTLIFKKKNKLEHLHVAV